MKCAECRKDLPKPPETGATGYAIRHGRKICYACSDKHERKTFAKAQRFTCYVSGDEKTLTTWPGGELAKVTETRYAGQGFGGLPFCHVWATAPDGSRWYGRNGGHFAGGGMVITVRRLVRKVA